MFLHLSTGWNYKGQLQKIYLKINNELQDNYLKYLKIPEMLTENHIKPSSLLKIQQKKQVDMNSVRKLGLWMGQKRVEFTYS